MYLKLYLLKIGRIVVEYSKVNVMELVSIEIVIIDVVSEKLMEIRQWTDMIMIDLN